jgi:hypothetical protein
MSGIFKKVMCSDSEPTKNGSYKTEFGEQFFSTVSGWGLPYKGHWSYSTNTNPNWWLEEIELPSEEDIVKIAKEFEIYGTECSWWMFGFRKATELIKGGTK